MSKFIICSEGRKRPTSKRGPGFSEIHRSRILPIRPKSKFRPKLVSKSMPIKNASYTNQGLGVQPKLCLKLFSKSEASEAVTMANSASRNDCWLMAAVSLC